MRFIIRSGSRSQARADSSLLAAMGLPGGGVLRVGGTHVLVTPGEVATPNTLRLTELQMANANLSEGASIDATRAMLTTAARGVVSATDAPLDARHLARSLEGIPVTVGDRVVIRGAYG